MTLRLGTLRGRILAAVAPANALLIVAACGGETDQRAGERAGSPAGDSGTAGTTEVTPGVVGSGATGGVGMGVGTGGAGVGVGTGGAGMSGAGTGGGGTVGADGGFVPGPYTLGDVTAPAYNCMRNPVGTCCDYDFCFTPEEASNLFPAQAGAGGEAGAPAESCPNLTQQMGPCSFFKLGGMSEKDGKCCYVVNSGGCCGRPFVVGGAARQAALVTRDDWLSEMQHLAGDLELSPIARMELSRTWSADALLEHASIASFAWFALELLQVGAPASLVQAAQQASLEETRHARLCFELASRFGHRDLGPGQLPIQGLEARDLTELAVAVLHEGCIGETLAAAIAQAQLAVVGDEQCRAALEVIAKDEAEHSLLAWRFLRYAVDRGGQRLADRLHQALAEAPHSRPPSISAVPPEIWNHYGRLTDEQEQAIVEQTWRDMITPAAALLWADSAATRHVAVAAG